MPESNEEITIRIVQKSDVNNESNNGQATAQLSEAQARQNANSAGGENDEKKEAQKKTTKAVDGMSKAVNAGFSITTTIISGTLDAIEKIYGMLKKSSPLLETIENLFNLAMTLLFMPLGNALAETILPSIIELVDNILSMWETFDEQFNSGDLAGMLTSIMTTGIQYIGRFIENIGESLKGQTGLLGAIGRVLDVVGKFIQNGLEKVISTLLGIGTWVLEHLKELIALAVAFKAASISLDVIKIGLLIAQAKTPWAALAGAAAAAAIPAAIAGTATSSYLGGMGLAEGGYIPPTQGGQIITVGERGEGEYIVPESQINNTSIGGARNITNNFYGYTIEELKATVRDVLRDELVDSNYRNSII